MEAVKKKAAMLVSLARSRLERPNLSTFASLFTLTFPFHLNFFLFHPRPTLSLSPCRYLHLPPFLRSSLTTVLPC